MYVVTSVRARFLENSILWLWKFWWKTHFDPKITQNRVIQYITRKRHRNSQTRIKVTQWHLWTYESDCTCRWRLYTNSGVRPESGQKSLKSSKIGNPPGHDIVIGTNSHALGNATWICQPDHKSTHTCAGNKSAFALPSLRHTFHFALWPTLCECSLFGRWSSRVFIRVWTHYKQI